MADPSSPGRSSSPVSWCYSMRSMSALAVAPVVVSLQLLVASVPLTPGGAGTQQALIAPLSAGTN